MKLQIQKNEIDQKYHVFIAGDMDHTTLTALEELKGYKMESCRFDFKQLQHVETIGIIHWLKFAQDFFSGKKVEYSGCPTNWIMVMHRIPAIYEQANIVSVYAEYSCSECDNFSEELLEESVNMPQDLGDATNTKKCDNCYAEKLELVEIEEEFFHFKNFSRAA